MRLEGIPNAKLLLVGQGPLRADLEGRDRVHLLGVRDDVPDILAAADIFALASDWEGLPLAIIEAMAAGLPVVGRLRPGGRPAWPDRPANSPWRPGRARRCVKRACGKLLVAPRDGCGSSQTFFVL
jgi:Glycosyl transferases group 1